MDEKKTYPALEAAWEQICQDELGDLQLTEERKAYLIAEAEKRRAAYKALPWWKKIFKRTI